MSTLTYTNNLTNGTTADADEVMANFNDAKTVINGGIDANNVDLTDDYALTGLVTIDHLGTLASDFIHNIGIDYSAGTFKMVQAGGSDFSSTNPGYLTMSSTTAGRMVLIKVTSSNHLFVDDAGSSDIVGEEFGVTTGVAWGEDRPFFIYAVNSDNSDSGLAFAISPDPRATTSPATTNSGYHGNPASSQSDSNFFYLTSTDVTSTHASKPCRCIGSIRMQMSSSDDWTVQTLGNADGIGKFHGETFFTKPVSQNGATSGKYFVNNSGTAPTYTNINSQRYSVDRKGWVTEEFLFDNASGGTAGVNPGALELTSSYKFLDMHSTEQYTGNGVGFIFEDSGTATSVLLHCDLDGTGYGIQAFKAGSTTVVNNADQSSTDRTYNGTVRYKAF